jgi:hypothetical protein
MNTGFRLVLALWLSSGHKSHPGAERSSRSQVGQTISGEYFIPLDSDAASRPPPPPLSLPFLLVVVQIKKKLSCSRHGEGGEGDTRRVSLLRGQSGVQAHSIAGATRKKAPWIPSVSSSSCVTGHHITSSYNLSLSLSPL